MSEAEIRKALVEKVKSREGKNQYTQSEKRTLVAWGYSDCSSLMQWAYREVLGIDIGEDTAVQIVSEQLQTVAVPICDGVPMCFRPLLPGADAASGLLPGDLLFFRGSDCKRWRVSYVGHVEMYAGNGICIGHGEGLGPQSKDLFTYCRKRQLAESPVPPGNQGLICVRRWKS